MAGKTLNVLLLEDFLLLVSASSGSGVKFGYTVFVLFFFFSAQKQILLLMMPAINWHRYEIHCST